MSFGLKPPDDSKFWLPETYDFFTWAEAVKKSPQKPWLIADFIQAAGVNIISGAPKRAYKSWLSFTLAQVITTGRPMFGFKPLGGPQNVLFLEGESAPLPTVQRFEALAKGMGGDVKELTRGLFWSHIPAIQMKNPKDMDSIARMVEEHDIKVVFFDTLGKLAGCDENSNTEMNAVLRNLEKLRKLGCASVVIHHVTKGAYNREKNHDADEVLRGAGAISGGYDVHLHIRNPNTADWSEVLIERLAKEGQPKFFKGKWSISGPEGSDIAEIAAFSFEQVDSADSRTEREMDGYVCGLEPRNVYGVDKLKDAWQVTRKEAKEIAELLVDEGIFEERGRKGYYYG